MSRFRPWPSCRNCRMGPPLRSFADDAHDCIMVPDPQGSYRIQGCYGANAPPRQASSPLIRSAVVNLRATSETAPAPPRPMVFEEVRPVNAT